MDERQMQRKRRRKRRRRNEIILKIEVFTLVVVALVLTGVVIVEQKQMESAVNYSAENGMTEPGNETCAQELETQINNKEQESGSYPFGEVQGTENTSAEQTKNGGENSAATNSNEIEESKDLSQGEAGEVVLAFAGDICFHDEYANMYSYREKGSNIGKCISEELLEEMRQADLFMVNNEFVYTDRGEPLLDKTYTLRSKPENVEILHDMGVDLVSLANNHAYDYGEISLLDTLDTLKEAGITYVGAGENLAEASKAVCFEQNGVKIAYLSATQVERVDNPDTKGATETTSGVFRCWGKDIENLVKAVEEADKENDFVVVYIHWGDENTDELDWAQLDQAKLIAEAGADLVVGDHPHCLQGIYEVSGVPVIYSLGNFWFNSKKVDTGLLKVIIDGDGIRRYQFLPAIQENCTTKLVEGAEKERILAYMRSISPEVLIDEDGNVSF